MSSPNLDFPRPEEAQATFDELVKSTGVSQSASDEEKLAALRQLSAMDVVRLMSPQFATPFWDEEWFVYQDGRKPIAGLGSLAPWVTGVVTGSTKDEAALFGVTAWRTWNFDQLADRIGSAISDPDLATELMSAYGVSSTGSAETCLQGFVDMVTDSMFSGLPFIVAESALSGTSPPISIYKFDQPDTFSQSPLRGYAYHTIDNIYFCRLPSVAGPHADCEMRETADRFSQAVIDFAYGSQPWEAYRTSRQVMVFNGKDSGLAKSVHIDRWRRITESWDPIKAKGVQRSGHRLLGLRHSSFTD